MGRDRWQRGQLCHLGRESSHFCVGQSLGDDRESHGESSDEVNLQPLQRVDRQPGQNGQSPLQGPTRAAAGVRRHVQAGADLSRRTDSLEWGWAWVTQSSDEAVGVGGVNVL